MIKILILLKWKYLRWEVKHRTIKFHKFLARMYWTQELEKLQQYDRKQLSHLSYSTVRKLFIKEFPNVYLHNPYKTK